MQKRPPALVRKRRDSHVFWQTIRWLGPEPVRQDGGGQPIAATGVATQVIAAEKNVVVVVPKDLTLDLFVLGCGLQTGGPAAS